MLQEEQPFIQDFKNAFKTLMTSSRQGCQLCLKITNKSCPLLGKKKKKNTAEEDFPLDDFRRS